MNRGLDIFKKAQRLQGGTGEVRGKEPPFTEGGKWWWEKADEQHAKELAAEDLGERQASITEDMTPEERKEVMTVDPRLWSDSVREKIGAANEKAASVDEQGHARGTSNVGSNIFKNAQRMQSGMQLVNRLGYDPSKPTYGFGSGEPTRRGIDIGVSGAANVFLPGFGWVAGKIARGLWHTIQNMQMNGASKQQIQQVVQQQQQQQGADETEPPPMPTGSVDLPQDKPPPSAGVGIDPWGNPADPGEFWSDDFGRWTGGDEFGTTPGNYNLAGPGGVFGMHGLPSGHTVQNWDTAIGLVGEYGGGSNAGDTSRFASAYGYSRPYTEAQYNAPSSSHGTGQGPGYQLGPGWVPRASYAQYLSGFHPIGSVGTSTGPGGAAFQPFGPKGIGGGTPSSKPNLNQKAFAMGTSDVNPGLKLFHRKLLKKPKQKEQIQ